MEQILTKTELFQTFYAGYSDKGYNEISEWTLIPRVLKAEYLFLPKSKEQRVGQWYFLCPIVLRLLENEFDIMSIGKAIVKFAEKFNNNLWIKVETSTGIDIYFKARPTAFEYAPNYSTNTNFKIELQMLSEPICECHKGSGYEQSAESPNTPQE